MKPAFSGWYWQKQTIISQLWGGLIISTALLLLGCCSYQIDSFYSPSFLRWYMFLKYWFSLARVERLRKISISTGLLFTIWPTFHLKSNKTCFPPHIEQSSTSFIIYTFHLHEIATKLSKILSLRGRYRSFATNHGRSKKADSGEKKTKCLAGSSLVNCPTRWSLYCPLGICIWDLGICISQPRSQMKYSAAMY